MGLMPPYSTRILCGRFAHSSADRPPETPINSMGLTPDMLDRKRIRFCLSQVHHPLDLSSRVGQDGHLADSANHATHLPSRGDPRGVHLIKFNGQ